MIKLAAAPSSTGEIGNWYSMCKVAIIVLQEGSQIISAAVAGLMKGEAFINTAAVDTAR